MSEPERVPPLTVSIKSGPNPSFDSVVRLSNGTDLTKLGVTRIEVDITAGDVPEARITLVSLESLDLEGLRLALPMDSLVALAEAHGCCVVAKEQRFCCQVHGDYVCSEPMGHKGTHRGNSFDGKRISAWASLRDFQP